MESDASCSITIEDTSFHQSCDEEYVNLDALKDCLMERYKVEVHELTLNDCRRLPADFVVSLRKLSSMLSGMDWRQVLPSSRTTTRKNYSYHN